MTNHPSVTPQAPKARRLPKELRLRLLQLKTDDVVELPEVVKGMNSKEYESLVQQNVTGPGVYRIQFRAPLGRREALKLERFITAGFKFKKYQPTTWDKYAKGPTAPYIGLRPCHGRQCPARKALLLFPSPDGSTNEGPYISATFHIPPYSDHTCMECATSHEETTSVEEPSTYDEESRAPLSPFGPHMQWFSPMALAQLQQQPQAQLSPVPPPFDEDSLTPPESPSASPVSSPSSYDLEPSIADPMVFDAPKVTYIQAGVVTVSLPRPEMAQSFYTAAADPQPMFTDSFEVFMQDANACAAAATNSAVGATAQGPVNTLSFSFPQLYPAGSASVSTESTLAGGFTSFYPALWE